MMRSTSKESWDQFKGSKARVHCIKIVLEALSKHGSSTGREICAYAGHDGLWKRLSEMARDGYIREKGKRVCKVTNKKAIEWEIVEKKEEKALAGPLELNNLWE